MLHVTRLFLTTLDDGVASLPAPASFGDMPNLPFLPASYVTPTVPDDAFWEMVERHLPPVPRAPPGHEAEAPWVRPRRRVMRRRGQGMIPD